MACHVAVARQGEAQLPLQGRITVRPAAQTVHKVAHGVPEGAHRKPACRIDAVIVRRHLLHRGVSAGCSQEGVGSFAALVAALGVTSTDQSVWVQQGSSCCKGELAGRVRGDVVSNLRVGRSVDVITEPFAQSERIAIGVEILGYLCAGVCIGVWDEAPA